MGSSEVRLQDEADRQMDPTLQARVFLGAEIPSLIIFSWVFFSPPPRNNEFLMKLLHFVTRNQGTVCNDPEEKGLGCW